MADFRIEGVISVDVADFIRDMKRVSNALDEATSDAKELDRAIDAIDGKNVQVDVQVSGVAEIQALEERLDRIQDETVNVDVDGAAKAIAQMEAVDSLAEGLDGEKIDIDVTKDTHEDIDRLNRGLKKSSEQLANVKLMGLKLIPALVLLGTALLPLAAGTSAWIAGLVGLIGAIATSFGVVAAFAIPTVMKFIDRVKSLQEVYEKIKNAKSAEELNDALEEQERILGVLGPKMRVAVEGYFELKEAYKEYARELRKPVLDIIISSISFLQTLMRETFPIAESMAVAIDNIVKAANRGLKGDEWGAFFEYIADKGDELFTKLMLGFGNILTGFANLVVSLDPLTQKFIDGFVNMTASFRDWARELGESKGFKDFLQWLEENGPKMNAFFSELWQFIKNIIPPLTELGVEVLEFVTYLLQLANQLAESNPKLFDMAIKFGLVGAALGPLLPGLLTLIGRLLFMNPVVGLTVLAVAALAGGFIYAYQQNDEFKRRVDETATTLKQNVIAKYSELKAWVMGVVPSMSEAWRLYGNNVKSIVDGHNQGMVLKFQGGINVIGGVIRMGLGLITGDWRTFSGGVEQLVRGSWQLVRGIIETHLNIIRNTFSIGFTAWKQAWQMVWDGIQWATRQGMNNVRNTIEWMMGGLGNILWSSGVDIMRGLYNGITWAWNNVVRPLLSRITSWIPDWKGPETVDKKLLFDSGKYVMQGFSQGIDSQVPNLESQLQGITNSVARMPGVGSTQSNSAGGMTGGIHIEKLELTVTVTGDADPRAVARSITSELDKLETMAEYGMFTPFGGE